MRDVIRKDRKLGVRAVAEEVSLDRESIRQILRKELNMRMVCAKMVPKLLSAVSTQKGTILKAIVVDFLNFLNKKFFYLFLFYLFDQQSEYTAFHKLMCWQESSLWTF
jgi:hypothetical protein